MRREENMKEEKFAGDNREFLLSEEVLASQLVLPKYSTKVRITVMNTLLQKGLVELMPSRTGEFWRLTKQGEEILK